MLPSVVPASVLLRVIVVVGVLVVVVPTTYPAQAHSTWLGLASSRS